jgi:CO dehydrogenase nickel-insertion accessory protein CooC1
MSWRAWLDASPVAQVALALMRDATGRSEPLEPITPARPAAVASGRVVAFWSLTAGAGASTVAALVAHRSAAARRPAVLIDLDRRAPTLALRAGIAGATVADALLRPGSERESLSRWRDSPFLPGTPELGRTWDGPRIAELIDRLRADAPAVIDLGTGVEALDGDVLGAIDRLCVVVGPTVGQLQAAFCSVPLLERCAVAGSVVVGATEDDAARIAARLPWRLLASVPRDPFLAADEFATRAPTLRSIDALIRSLG